ncbi:GA module, partial [Gemelliphila asaccharolytica]
EQLKADIEGSATIGEHNYAKKLAEAKKELESIIEKKFQDPKQKASVLKDLAKLKTLKEVEQLKADIEGSTTIGEHNDAKKLAAAKDKAVKTVKELKKLTEAEKTKAIAEINKANTEAEVNEALEKAKELDKKHGAENPSVTPTPDVTPSPDVTPTPETKAGWQKDEKGWWYLRENGTYPAGEWEPVGEKWYHFDPQGYMQTGWLNLDGTWYYLNADGSMAKDTWIGTYYVDANGAWVIEGWQNQGYGWWYQRANGSYPSNGWEMINGIWYYFDANGYMLANTTTPDGYYVDENGAWVK